MTRPVRRDGPQPLAAEGAARAGTPHRDTLRSGGAGPAWIALRPGAYHMGASPGDAAAQAYETPSRIMRLSAAFALGEAPVTFEEFEMFCAATGRAAPDDFGMGRAAHPVINVSRREALDYCAWLSAETGAAYALPSEAEWEYACRAGAETPFAHGAEITSAQANFDPADADDPIGRRGGTTPVRAFSANRWGFFDMHGNVGEWCADGWTPELARLPEDGRPAPLDAEDPMASAAVRGGGWSTKRQFIRCSDRWHYAPDAAFEMVGFRIRRAV
ncbi:MAG: formylglycine-generating enzyme family protein [Pseudomonadota bacterium]